MELGAEQRHALWTLIKRRILDRRVRGLIQHREALLVDCDPVRHSRLFKGPRAL